jgi:hypothetical protein
MHPRLDVVGMTGNIQLDGVGFFFFRNETVLIGQLYKFGKKIQIFNFPRIQDFTTSSNSPTKTVQEL